MVLINVVFHLSLYLEFVIYPPNSFLSLKEIFVQFLHRSLLEIYFCLDIYLY